ncbi:jouberin isoform X2 [Poeciliopsis prolifica]|uniref:jouberin isoform X2 n=1 Tax=Poeciliopsis prolifica TaxID=188132 RepID=UPI002413FC1D|nr:jouberin isoform X2 [Poeciliopsis prolifica]
MPVGASEERAKTRERFNEIFKKYTESEKKKSKKKNTDAAEAKETIVLQNLRKKPNLENDTEEDETVLQNTRSPEEDNPSYNSSKTSKAKKKSTRNLPPLPALKDNTSDIRRDTDPELAVDGEETGGGKGPKRRSKKGKSKDGTKVTTESQVADRDDELLHEYQLQIAQEEERTTKKTRVKEEDDSVVWQNASLNNNMGKKKKKKMKSVATDSDAGDPDEDVEREVDAEPETESKGKKKKKKKHVVKEESDAEPEESVKQTCDDGLVLGVFVHRTDRLKTDLLISNPMVKIHVVDEITGKYVTKENCQRPVSSLYEQENVSHILPIITHPFDFRKNKSIIPEWQEQILFNERFGYFLQQIESAPRVILFFEILDFMTVEEAKANFDADKHERGFRKIAWAFLKLVGANGILNIESKLRLQLFCPPPRAKRQPETIEVFEWWRKYPRTKYASTLYVTVKGIKPPECVDPGMSSMMALQEERGTTYSDLQNEPSKTEPSLSRQPVLRWNRLPGQICRIPNKHGLAFRGGRMGCFTVLFSHSGTRLAAACADRDAFPVVVYEIPSGIVLAAFNGHLKIVYDLCWSNDDRVLLSASSDGTVREWDVERLLENAQKVLPHPSFVYCAQYHPGAQNLVVTGSYDCLIRVWRLDVDDVNGQMLQEFEAHKSFVNSVCFDFEGRRMFSADNTGIINVWKTSVNGSKQRQHPCQHWSIEMKIDESDLRGIPINMLQLHPNGRCLLIHAKDSVLRMMDLRILAIKKYTGATNYRERIYSTFTPCGNFIFSGSEDGIGYVWNTDTGDQVAVYSELCYRSALHGVSFHPHENMVAFCAFGQSQPVHVYLYDQKVSQLEMCNNLELSRSASLDAKPVQNAPDPVVPQDTPTFSTMDQFGQLARFDLKMQCVKDHLESVLEPYRRNSAVGLGVDQDKTGTTHAARSFTSDVATGLNASLPPPSLLSPHSKLQLSGSLADQLIPQAVLSTQSRGISQRMKGASSLKLHRSLPDQTSSGFYDPDSARVQQIVVSIYNYEANRSDELTIRRGDVIQVLYKDNDTWWFGRLVNGLQGYFLASYVIDRSEFSDDSTERDPTSLERHVERLTPTRVSAAVNSSGELRFLSEATFSDTDPELTDAKTRRRRKVKKPGVAATQTNFPEVEASGSARKGRPPPRPLPKRPTGQANRAFQPD